MDEGQKTRTSSPTSVDSRPPSQQRTMSSQTSLSPLPPLPSETLLQILGHLALPDLAWALRVNSSWLLLVQHHQQGIFKTMAIAHGYLNEAEGELGMTLEQLGAREGLLKGVESWRDLCELARGDGRERRESALTFFSLSLAL